PITTIHAQHKLPENISLRNENISSMCLKEAVTNVDKHSQAKTCRVDLQQLWKEVVITVTDDGTFQGEEKYFSKGHGLLGMR
ncbi:ATP-binding protein, partial [Bacillus spizizenii]|nr:sensor histidine kinase [Bacillus spizizenii]